MAAPIFSMKGYVYIIHSEKSGRYYIGSTNNLERRLKQHDAGSVVATRNKGPWKRVAWVEFATPMLAKKAECHLKRQKSRRAVEMVISGSFTWPDF